MSDEIETDDEAVTKRPRSEWGMPQPTEQRCSNCEQPLVPTAVCAYDDGWSLEWTCGDEWCDGWGLGVTYGDDLEWPFDEDEGAGPEDLKALGFIVIVI